MNFGANLVIRLWIKDKVYQSINHEDFDDPLFCQIYLCKVDYFHVVILRSAP